MEVILTVLGGAALGALVTQAGEYLRAKQQHSYDKENADATTHEELQARMDALTEGLRYLMLDRIRYVGQSYLKQGSVDFDDRRILNNMHCVYHNALKGNGDLYELMRDVNSLPLKID